MGDNTKTVREAYAAFGRGDIPGLLSALSDDVEWEHAESADIPSAGKFRGHEGVVKFFTATGESADFQAFEPHTFIDGRDNVVVPGREKVKHKANGREWATDCCHIGTLNNGKAANLYEYTNAQAVAAAFG